jgi:hypothetical protein
MDRILANVNDRIEKVVESELKGMTLADLVSDSIDRRTCKGRISSWTAA